MLNEGCAAVTVVLWMVCDNTADDDGLLRIIILVL